MIENRPLILRLALSIYGLTIILQMELKAQEIDPDVLSAPIVEQVSDPEKPFSVLIDITLIPGKEAEFEKAFVK